MPGVRTPVLPIVLFLALAAAGCQDPYEYDLHIGPELELLAAEPTSATIGWANAYPDAIEYRLERRQEGKSSFKVVKGAGRLPPDVKQFTDPMAGEPGLKEDKKYFYRLRAKFKGGRLARSVILKVFVEDRVEPAKSVSARPVPAFGEIPWLGAVAGEPRLSPDGALLAWVEGGRVLLMDACTGDVRPVPGPPAVPAGGVAWTPDGAALVVPQGSPGSVRLALVAVETGETRVVLPSGRGGTDPDVSPDGARIAFVRGGGIFEARMPDGRVVRLLAGAAGKPRWSPEGRRLAFLLRVEGTTEVRVAARAPDGSLGASVTVGREGSGAGPLVWSPDGETLAYPGVAGDLHVVPVDAGGEGGGR